MADLSDIIRGGGQQQQIQPIQLLMFLSKIRQQKKQDALASSQRQFTNSIASANLKVSQDRQLDSQLNIQADNKRADLELLLRQRAAALLAQRRVVTDARGEENQEFARARAAQAAQGEHRAVQGSARARRAEGRDIISAGERTARENRAVVKSKSIEGITGFPEALVVAEFNKKYVELDALQRATFERFRGEAKLGPISDMTKAARIRSMRKLAREKPDKFLNMAETFFPDFFEGLKGFMTAPIAP